jgi:hypothetical protein
VPVERIWEARRPGIIIFDEIADAENGEAESRVEVMAAIDGAASPTNHMRLLHRWSYDTANADVVNSDDVWGRALKYPGE